MSWRVIRVATISLWGIVLLTRGNLGLAIAPVITTLSGECNLGSVSSQQRSEAMDVKALSASELSESLCYSSWTDQFYLENISSRREGMPTQRCEEKRQRDRERMHACAGEKDPWPFGSCFYMFFLPHWACPM